MYFTIHRNILTFIQIFLDFFSGRSEIRALKEGVTCLAILNYEKGIREKNQKICSRNKYTEFFHQKTDVILFSRRCRNKFFEHFHCREKGKKCSLIDKIYLIAFHHAVSLSPCKNICGIRS